MIPLPLLGGCQCGALRYEIRQAPLMVYNCHCTNCQKVSGGAFSTAVTILEAGFEFIAGTPHIVDGSRIANGQRPAGGFLSLRAGTLDDTRWVEPVGDIWLRSAQPWVSIPDGRLRAEQQPGDYAPYAERFRAQGRFTA